jgi:preprotein translocase subunit SecD
MIFQQVTRENIKKRLAIVLDGNVYSAPVIQDEIPGGRAQITGRFNSAEARDLAIVLRAGALPAPVVILENRTVGPSLGKDSIEKGFTSIIYGSLLVVVFIIFYYKWSGVIAVTALFLNIVILAGALAYFGAALTLPGIAGIILTVGMAIDANVLVFERIREEVRIGKTVRAAIDAGFSKAFRTIVDANITTFIAAVVLFQFGTGPIKGFAITLCIGIAASMFTAVFVSRAIFDATMSQRKLDKLSI